MKKMLLLKGFQKFGTLIFVLLLIFTNLTLINPVLGSGEDHQD